MPASGPDWLSSIS